jgi:hypothetical protein
VPRTDLEAWTQAGSLCPEVTYASKLPVGHKLDNILFPVVFKMAAGHKSP